MNVSTARPRRIPQLDVLRALAIFLVIGRHSGFKADPALPGIINAFFCAWARCGWIGVDLFFVLSGYLISGLLYQDFKRTGTIHVFRFYIRRGFKIYPSYYALLISAVLVYLVLLKSSLNWATVVYETFFLQNYRGFMYAGATWSLAIEEHFYIVLPLILLWLVRSKPRDADPFQALPRLFFWLAGGCLLARIATAQAWSYAPQFHLMPTHLRIDSLFCGVVLGYYDNFHREKIRDWFQKRGFPWHLASLLCIAPMVLGTLEQNVFIITAGFTLLYMGFGWIMMALLCQDWSETAGRFAGSRCVRFVTYIGERSYSIFLWHLMMRGMGMRIVKRLAGGELPQLVDFAVSFCGAILLGILMANILEMPVLKLRERWAWSAARST